MNIKDIDTPALVIDLDIMENNIKTVAEFFKARECNLRPHVKFCKTPIIAYKMLKAGGAKGICTAKLSEAEMMASAGIDDIFVTNEIVTRQKIERLARLSKWCDVKVAADNPANVEELSKIAQQFNTKINVLVDVNVSQFGKIDGALDRTGVLPGKEAVTLAKTVLSSKGLIFRGLMGYEGSMAEFDHSFEGRKKAVHKSLKPLIDTRDMIKDEGIEVEIVSAGCTSNWNITGDYPGITEVQAGTFALMDLFHSHKGVQVKRALTILTTIISTPYPGKAISDVGFKGLYAGPEGEMPKFKDIEGVEIGKLNAEHTHLILKNPSKEIKVGDKFEIYPFICEVVVNLYDKFYATRNSEVEAEWKILGRGKSQ